MSTYDLSDYYKVESYRYGLLRNGDYIRWEKTGGKITRGAVIKFQHEYDGKKYWQLAIGKKKISMYWDTVPYVWVRKPVYYDDWDNRMKELLAYNLFLIKEFKLNDKFIEFRKNVNEELKKTKQKKQRKALLKRSRSASNIN